ncbi:MAG TPA: hypothetical protein P5337_06350 [Aestuariivirga sp.]|nr:hypothetical protein [Aestuariivirga sp.]
MKRIVLMAAAASALAGCKTDSTVRITNDKPQVQMASRSEPIFYNGKTYRLDFGPSGQSGLFDMTVSGMGPKQRNDAVAVATSSLGYFACPDGQKGRLQNEPAYASSKWRMQARCG